MSWVKSQGEGIHKIMDQVGGGSILWEGQGGERCGTPPPLSCLAHHKAKKRTF